MKRAGLYIRVSDEDQVKGHSLGQQLKKGKAFIKQQGWQLVQVYEEPGNSARHGSRPIFWQAVEDCKNGRTEILVTDDFDRGFRNLREKLNTLHDFSEWGTVYASVNENLIIRDINALTPNEWLLVVVRGATSQFDSDHKAEKIKDGKEGRVGKGLSNAGVLPHGYKRKKKKGPEKVDKKAARAVRLAFEAYATGQYTDQEICDLLTREGHKPHAGIRRGRWCRDTIRYMLRNRFYIGKVKYHGEWLPGRHKPIISRELFDRAQEARRRRRSGAPGGRGTGRAYLLQRIVRCTHCGLAMHASRISKGGTLLLYYRDSAKIQGLDCPAAGRHVPMDVIDQQVGELVKRLQLPDDWRDRLQDLAGHQEERKNIEGQRRYVHGKIRRLRELYLDGDFAKAEYNRRKAELETQLDALSVPEVPAVEAAGETLESLGEEWASAPKRYQRDMLRVILEAVYIDPLARVVVCVKPWPQFAPLFRLDGLREKERCFYVDEEEGQEARSEG